MEHVLSSWQLAATAVLVVASAGLSLWMQMGIARPLLVAAARTVVQLLLVGLVLKTLFANQSAWLTVLVMLAMLGAAGYETFSRQDRRFAGGTAVALAGFPIAIASVSVTGFALATMRPEHWLTPQVAIPLFGIVLGNAMSSASVTLNTFTGMLVRERAAVEAQLALGASRYTALAPLQRSAARNGMIPIINQMAAAGVITLPGMMTGQILAGMAPYEAAKYQIFVLFLLSGATGLGALAATLGASWRVTDERHRLRLDRTVARG
jgi:putative ABC transport system permease protein